MSHRRGAVEVGKHCSVRREAQTRSRGCRLRVLAAVLSVTLLTACSLFGRDARGPAPPGPGANFPALWSVAKDQVVEQGVTLRLLGFQESVRGNDLAVFYALYEAETSASDLAPGEIILNDDTGRLATSGKTLKLGRFEGVSFGTITLQGLLLESNTLSLRMRGVRRTGPAGDDVVAGEWAMPEFMVKVRPGTEQRGEAKVRYKVVGVNQYEPKVVRDVTATLRLIYSAPERFYMSWGLEAPDGASQELFYTVSRTGEVRALTRAEYDRAVRS